MPNLDERILVLARTRGHTPDSERAVAAFSKLGEHSFAWLAIGAAGAALDGPRRGCWLRGLATVAGAYVANTAIKFAVRRPRPQLEDLPPLVGTPTGLGFPSAHTTTGFAGALAFSRCGAPPAPLYALALGLSLSRLYLGVHHPSDLVAGAALGTAVAAAAPALLP